MVQRMVYPQPKIRMFFSSKLPYGFLSHALYNLENYWNAMINNSPNNIPFQRHPLSQEMNKLNTPVLTKMDYKDKELKELETPFVNGESIQETPTMYMYILIAYQ